MPSLEGSKQPSHALRLSLLNRVRFCHPTCLRADLIDDLRQQGWEWNAVLTEQQGSIHERSDVLIGNRPAHDLRIQHLIGEEAGEA
ncbi:hypothetical protein [Methylobacterium sp. WL116]|uniref:hypothetical protein n=1 Tax=Methylobacterium sp. WL116 TaxID=2603889 RepID=UPI00164FE991|nr:hypothetical protein [Methylobacterium sp. WL116]